jgi:hypothetical protein
MGVRLRGNVGDQKPAVFLQLVIQLGRNLVSEQSPKGQVRGHEEHADDRTEEKHHPEAKSFGFHGSTAPSR